MYGKNSLFFKLIRILRECQRHITVTELGEEAPHVVDVVAVKGC